jgi:FAD/FMN-containing dehydrogenase
MSALPSIARTANALSEEALAAYRARLRGQLIGPEDADYDSARRVYNAMIDRRPRLIARCVDVADVIHSVNFAREQDLPLAVRGGGHNGPGLGTVDDGLVIDLAPMKGIRVNPDERTVRVEGGCTWGEVDHATHVFGLATPSGFVSTTGVGGLTLGGGIGYLSRKYGLTIDNLLGVDMVLADGSFVSASAEENTDLYWAVRGGGGNFGVVTSFLFRLHPVSTVYGGPLFWPVEMADPLIRFWQDFLATAPDDLNGWFGFAVVPPVAPFPAEWQGKTMCVIVWCFTGPLDQGEAALAPVRAFAAPAIDLGGPIPWPALQSMFDALFPPGLQWYWKADFFERLSDEAIALHVKHGTNLPTAQSTMHLYLIDGAAGRVGPADTAFHHRQARFAEVMVGVDPDPANNEAMMRWANDYWRVLHPLSTGGGYINMMMEEGEERVKASYGDNYTRLAQIKARYDPHNLFRVNQNIRPEA